MSREVCGYCGLEVPCGCKGSAGIVSQDSDLDRLRKENFALAAGQCIVPDGGLSSDDGGIPYCAMKRQVDSLRDELRRATRANETLREIRDVFNEEDRRLRKENAALREALEIIAGERQCIDNLMSNSDVARAALQGAKDD